MRRMYLYKGFKILIEYGDSGPFRGSTVPPTGESTGEDPGRVYDYLISCIETRLRDHPVPKG